MHGELEKSKIKHRRIRTIGKTICIIVTMLLTVSGCAVTTSTMNAAFFSTEQKQESQEYEKVIEAMNSPYKKSFKPQEISRIQNESLRKIYACEAGADTGDMIGFRRDHLMLTRALIELGQFDRALKVCDEGLKVGLAFHNARESVRKKCATMRFSEGVTESLVMPTAATMAEVHNGSFLRKMYLYKCYATWFLTGNKETSFKGYEDQLLQETSDDDKMFMLLDRALFYDKILGRYDESARQYEDALKAGNRMHIFNADTQYMYELKIYSQLAQLYMKQGKLQKALETMDRYEALEKKYAAKVVRFALSFFESRRTYLASIDCTAGALYALMRDFKKSEMYFQKAKEQIGKIDMQTASSSQKRLAATYHVFYGTYYLGLQGRYGEAVREVDAGLSDIKPYYIDAIENDLNVETAYLNSGELHYLVKNYGTAINRAEDAFNSSKRYYNWPTQAAAKTLLGQTYWERGVKEQRTADKQNAKEAYETAQKLAKGMVSTENWKLYLGLGRVYEERGDLVSARKYYKDAIDEVEKVWSGKFKDTAKQVSFIDDRLRVFEPMIGLCVKSRDFESAFRYIEMSKSRTFFETSVFDPVLPGTNAIGPESEKIKASPEERERLSVSIEDLSAKIGEIDKKLDQRSTKSSSSRGVTVKESTSKESGGGAANQLSQNERKKLLDQRAKYQKELSTLQTRADTMSSPAPQFKPKRDIAALQIENTVSIRRTIGGNVSVLEYYVGQDSVFGLVLNNKQFHVAMLGVTPEKLRKEVLSFRMALAKGWEGYEEQATGLYGLLVKPFEKQLTGTDSICVIPHGVLHYLPFHALALRDNSKKGISPELLQKERDLYAQLQKLPTTKKTRGVILKEKAETKSPKTGDAEEALLAIQGALRDIALKIDADRKKKGIKEYRPVFLADERKVFYAPSSTILSYLVRQENRRKEKLFAAGSPPDVEVTDPDLENGLWDALSGAETELRKVAESFKDNNRVISGAAATETMVKSQSGGYDVLLFSTHGALSRTNPQKSCVFFNKDGNNDGFLAVWEIERLSLNASLVVLSACETGLQSGNQEADKELSDVRFPYGDDLVGLQRSFLKAGSSSVMSTLWKVNDLTTPELVIKFFNDYKRNKYDKIGALQAAQKRLIEDGLIHPYYWAPFVLSGDWR